MSMRLYTSMVCTSIALIYFCMNNIDVFLNNETTIATEPRVPNG